MVKLEEIVERNFLCHLLSVMLEMGITPKLEASYLCLEKRKRFRGNKGMKKFISFLV